MKPDMKRLKSFACAMAIILSSAPTFAADSISGQVVGAGAPIVGSTVTLWAEGSGAPRQLAQARTGADGRFALTRMAMALIFIWSRKAADLLRAQQAETTPPLR